MPNSQQHPLITVVCTANICRSPMAERLLAHALASADSPLDSIRVCSAGVAAIDGDLPSANSVRALKAVGLKLSDHRSQPLTEALVEESDLILCMTRSHCDVIHSFFEPEDKPVLLFRQPLAEQAGVTPEIPDPFGMDLKAYVETRDSMVEAIPAILDWLRQHPLPSGGGK